MPLTQVPDPVFAQEMLGPGLAIRLRSGAESTIPSSKSATNVFEISSPVGGTVAVMKPHAFIVKTEAGFSVLTHLGIDTIHEDAAQFELCESAQQSGRPWQVGDRVQAGAPMVRWSPAGNGADTTEQRGGGIPALSADGAPGAPLVMMTVLELAPSSTIERTAPDGVQVSADSTVLVVRP